MDMQLNAQRSDRKRQKSWKSEIRAALDAPWRTEGVRKIAKRLGVDSSTVQRISRPFDGASIVPPARATAVIEFSDRMSVDQ